MVRIPRARQLPVASFPPAQLTAARFPVSYVFSQIPLNIFSFPHPFPFIHPFIHFVFPRSFVHNKIGSSKRVVYILPKLHVGIRITS